jgi:hypothetical protein
MIKETYTEKLLIKKNKEKNNSVSYTLGELFTVTNSVFQFYTNNLKNIIFK